MAYKLVSHVINRQRFFVHKINDITYRERLFCILDTEQPFELSLRYKELSKSMELAPVIAPKGGLVMQERTDLETEYKFRLSTEEECKKHIEVIQNKRDLIDEMLIGFTEDMMLEHNRKMLKKLENFNQSRKRFNV
jgi:hypothetical protein